MIYEMHCTATNSHCMESHITAACNAERKKEREKEREKRESVCIYM